MAERGRDDGHTVAVEIDAYGTQLVFACTDPTRCKWQEDGECHFLLFMENGDPEESMEELRWRPEALPAPILTYAENDYAFWMPKAWRVESSVQNRIKCGRGLCWQPNHPPRRSKDGLYLTAVYICPHCRTENRRTYKARDWEGVADRG